MESGTPDPELVAAMQQYDEEMRKAGVLVAVERLQPSANATRLRMSKGQFRTVDGPFTETNELIAGVNIIDVASREEAIAWMKRCTRSVAQVRKPNLRSAPCWRLRPRTAFRLSFPEFATAPRKMV